MPLCLRPYVLLSHFAPPPPCVMSFMNGRLVFPVRGTNYLAWSVIFLHFQLKKLLIPDSSAQASQRSRRLSIHQTPTPSTPTQLTAPSSTSAWTEFLPGLRVVNWVWSSTPSPCPVTHPKMFQSGNYFASLLTRAGPLDLGMQYLKHVYPLLLIYHNFQQWC